MSRDYSPKPIEELVKHLHENRGIEVRSEHTRQLLNYGYYHAYKGYRFFKKAENIIPFTSFEQILAVIDYDNDLKVTFYSAIMFLETALKNIVVANVIDGLPSAYLNDVLKYRMNDDGGNEMLIRQRKKIKEKIHSAISKRYSQNNPIVTHFCKRGDEIPLWALFEVLSLSDFASFTYCLNKHVRIGLLRDLHMQIEEDKEHQLLANILYTIKDLRNALAHNNVIFDVRFSGREISPTVCRWLNRELRLDVEPDFSSILDYYLLVAVLLQKIEYGDEKIAHFMNSFEGLIDALYEKVPQNIYQKLTTTQCITKLDTLKDYIANA